jgi:hypothetical protein
VYGSMVVWMEQASHVGCRSPAPHQRLSLDYTVVLAKKIHVTSTKAHGGRGLCIWDLGPLADVCREISVVCVPR